MASPPAYNASTFFPPRADRYRVLRALGSGAYGVVAACEDAATGQLVAVKKVPQFLVDATDAKRVLREVKLMRHFRGHERILTLIAVEGTGAGGAYASGGLYLDGRARLPAGTAPADAWRCVDDVYIVSTILDSDLHKVIYSRNKITLPHMV